MPEYRLSNAAVADIETIGMEGVGQFGFAQALKYHAGLESRFELIAQFPRIGHPAYDLEPGLYQFLYRSHMIFYMIEPDHVLVARVLNARYDFKRHFR